MTEAPPAPSPLRCAACDAPLEHDQEWCVECGTARTVVHAPPSWRGAIAVIAVVVGVVVIAGVVALVTLT